MKIKGVKKAVGEYKCFNSGGYYSPEYGELMLDMSNGEVWTDRFYSLGHNEWNEYHSDAIINLGQMIVEDGECVTMATVKEYATKMIQNYTKGDKKHE